jgi:hypothetical protein
MRTTGNMYIPIRYQNGWRRLSGNWFPWYLFLPWVVASFCGVTMLFYVLISKAYSSPTPTMQWTALVGEVESTETTTDLVNASDGSNDSKTR